MFPEAHRIALAESIDVGMPAARRSALKELAVAAVADPNLFRSFGTIEEAIARFRKIRGVGEWTAQYIALRALRETDAFPAADIGLLRGAEVVDGTRSTTQPLAAVGVMAAMALTQHSTSGPAVQPLHQSPGALNV